jgi:hypothetical protein
MRSIIPSILEANCGPKIVKKAELTIDNTPGIPPKALIKLLTPFKFFSIKLSTPIKKSSSINDLYTASAAALTLSLAASQLSA